MERSRGVRKGAWSKTEDDRLRACVQQYGEGKWNLVPKRAGLNRCRKSCRLRWLNYLNPTIKQGEFNEDEVDLIIRLHKLLGNRWSLIAGRLPGRTPNGVKNYWNTNIRKKVFSHKEDIKATRPKETNQTTKEHHVVIKPQPRTITRTNWPLSRGNNKIIREDDQSGNKECTSDQAYGGVSSECNNNSWFDTWWGTLLEDKGSNNENDIGCLGSDSEQHGMLVKDLNWDGGLTTTQVEDFLIEGQSWSDVLGDINWWDS